MKNFNKKEYKEKILFLLRNNWEEQVKKIIKQIVNEEYIDNDNISWLYDFFSPIFDEIFYDLLFERIKITNSTKILLERLAIPLWKLDELNRNKIIKKIK